MVVRKLGRGGTFVELLEHWGYQFPDFEKNISGCLGHFDVFL